MEEIIFETEHFKLIPANKPHISREEGGHLVIFYKDKSKGYSSRLDFTPEEAKEAMYLSMIGSEAMLNVLPKYGINIQRINYQENGNWAYLRGENPVFHIHLYGRTPEAVNQPWGQALYFPTQGSDFYKSNIPFTEEEVLALKEEALNLSKKDKYNYDNWR